MKKFILSALTLIALSFSARAQFSLGIKGGVNYSNINMDYFNHSGVAGYQAGLFARIGGPVYLQPEVYVSSTGGKFESNDNSFSGNVRFTNLNVPVLIGVRFGPKNLNLRVMAGPEYISDLNTSKNFPAAIPDIYENFGNDYKTNNLGYQAGFGVDIGAITADLRYQGNFSDINSNYHQRPDVWALSIGFKLL